MNLQVRHSVSSEGTDNNTDAGQVKRNLEPIGHGTYFEIDTGIVGAVTVAAVAVSASISICNFYKDRRASGMVPGATVRREMNSTGSKSSVLAIAGAPAFLCRCRASPS